MNGSLPSSRVQSSIHVGRSNDCNEAEAWLLES